jgi:hypothetical protein
MGVVDADHGLEQHVGEEAPRRQAVPGLRRDLALLHRAQQFILLAGLSALALQRREFEAAA